MGRVVLEDFMEFFKGPDIVIINRKDDGSTLFRGFWSMLRENPESRIPNYPIRTIKDYRCHVEIRHKDWKEKGLEAPMLPDMTPQYSFKDLQCSLIHEFWI